MTGGEVSIRPITPDDSAALRAAFERLSPESRYRRFFGPMPMLSDRDLRYLTQVDQHDHVALVATDEDERIVGVARFVRTSADQAEPAIVVADDWQGRGVGALLLDTLADRAREEAVARFRAPVLAQNAAAVKALSRLGPTVTTAAGREIELDIELTPEQEAQRGLRLLLRRAANGTMTPALTLLQRLSWRAPRTPLDRALRNTIVVGADGSAGSAETVRRAGELAQSLQAQVELVALSAPVVFDAGEAVPKDVGELAHDLRARGVRVAVHLKRSGPVASLVEVAAEVEARLIVVDASERTGVGRMLAGDIPYAVARHAPCDVLMLRSAPVARGALGEP